jgi:hypothetical protein
MVWYFGFQVIKIQNTLPYDPQIGFTLDLDSNKIPEPYDTYKCTRGDDSVTITVKPTPGKERI